MRNGAGSSTGSTRRLPGLHRWGTGNEGSTPEELLKARELAGEDGRRLTTPYDDRVPLPDGARQVLTPDNPRLVDLRRRYAGRDIPAMSGLSDVGEFLDIRYFRGETKAEWERRELPRAARLSTFIYLGYLELRDHEGLVSQLTEDGWFGCWTYDFAERRTVSRELLHSINELLFLERQMSLSARPRPRILDLGAGYGQLAHRATAAVPSLADYCCVDTSAASALLCEYYLTLRGCLPPARVVPVDQLHTLHPGDFDLAVSVRGLAACTAEGLGWWLARLRDWEVPTLFARSIGNGGIFKRKSDGSRPELNAVLEQAGCRIKVCEPAIDDEATREILRIDDHFYIFELD